MTAYGSILECIGNTPIVLLRKIPPKGSCVFAKLEGMNPGGSVKDRAAAAMIRDAEARGLLAEGGTIVEPTSGNTGISIAMAAAAGGYRAVLVMPDTMSKERISFMRAYGAEIVLTPGAEGMAGSVRRAEEIAGERGGFVPSQFGNPANPAIHRTTTGREILADLPDVSAVFAGIGSGGTASGIGMSLRDAGSRARVVGVEPAESPLLTEGLAGPHRIQGIGANFVPDNYDERYVDEVVAVKGDDAVSMTVRLAREEGVFAGISSGAAVHAAVCYAENHKNEKVVAILTDGGDRYLSTGVFD